MMKKRRLTLVLGLVAIVFVGAVCLLHTREPRYQGKRLSVWWDEIDNAPAYSRAEVEAYRAKFTNLVQSVGTKALPYYLACLKYKPSASWYDKLDDWVREKTSGKIRLPQSQDRSLYAQACIEVLGPAALPVLSNAVATVSDARVRYWALEGLGNLGTNARGTDPLLLDIIRKADAATDISLADLALRALVESETNRMMLMPLLVERLADTNTAPGAAYGLAQLGEPGVLVLLRATTNENEKISAAAEAALDMDFSKYDGYPIQVRFNGFKIRFNSRMISHAASSYSGSKYQRKESLLQHYTTNENETIRIMATNLLEHVRGGRY